MGIESPNVNKVEKTETEEEKYRNMLSIAPIQELERLNRAVNGWMRLSNNSEDGTVEIQGLGKRTKEQIEKRLQMIQEEQAKRQA